MEWNVDDDTETAAAANPPTVDEPTPFVVPRAHHEPFVDAVPKAGTPYPAREQPIRTMTTVTMRIFSHTCSNTEIVCALGGSDQLIGVDVDSDYPPDVVKDLPKPGRDLSLDVDGVMALRPDLVLTSLTVPGHERIVAEFEQRDVEILVCDPISLHDVFLDIRRIATALGIEQRGQILVEDMQRAMPVIEPVGKRPNILVEWWPKPVIVPGRKSWVTDIIHRAGGTNPWGALEVKSQPMAHDEAPDTPPDAVIMSWCGVPLQKYRADIVRNRPNWEHVPAVQTGHIASISEAYLGRPGPRLVEGYRQLRAVIQTLSQDEGGS